MTAAAAGNELPDATEMMVLEAVLENVGYNRVPNGGTGYQAVYAAWAANRTQAAADLPGEPAAIQRAIAAYMTLGESGHIAFAVSTALEVASVTLDPADYTDAPGLGALDDADGDSKWNRLEWMAVLEEYQVTTPTSADAAVYVNWVLNPELPADEDVDIGMDLPDGADPNWDYSYLPQGTVTFQSVDDVPIEVRILDPPGREDVPVVIGQPVDIPLGAELLITLAEGANPDWFFKWDAPGEMIDGSGEPSERFRLMRGGTIRPERRPITTNLSFVAPQTEFEWTYSWSGVGPFGHMIPAGSGTGQLDVPRGAYVRIRAHKSKAPAGGAKSSGAGNDVTYADIWSVDDPESSGPFIVFGQASAYGGPYFGSITATGTDAAPHGWLSHSAGCEQGGSGLIGATTSTNGSFFPFNYEVAKVPAPDPTDASHRILVVEAEMDPGYQAIGTTGFLGYYSGVLGAQSVLIETLKMLTLTLEVKVEGGGATPAEAGHVTAYEEDKAKKWYSPTNVEYVQLDASAHVGFYFTEWSGDGIAYADGGDGPDLETELALDNPNVPVTENPIWIAMGEDWGGGGEKAAGAGAGGRVIKMEFIEAICPDGETSSFSDVWEAGAAYFYATIDPASESFYGYQVTESTATDKESKDGCWYQGSPHDKLEAVTGGTWNVGVNNVYGPDRLSLGFLAILHYKNYYTNLDPNWKGCTVTVYQDMAINKLGCFGKYAQNALILEIRSDMLINVRDNAIAELPLAP